MSTLSYLELAGLLREEVKKKVPLPATEAAHQKALLKWKSKSESLLKELNGDVFPSPALRRKISLHNARRPKRTKPGTPSKNLPDAHRLHKHLRRFLARRGMLALPEDLNTHLKKIAEDIIADHK